MSNNKKKKPRSRTDIINYLMGHERYHTMNSWNNASSYARCVKLHSIDIPKEVEDTAWDVVMQLENYLDETGFSLPLDDFQEKHNYGYQWGMNGRSGGYVVMYEGTIEPTGHKSRCIECGQGNFSAVEEPADPEKPEEYLRQYVITNNWWRPEVYGKQPDLLALGLHPDFIVETVEKLRKVWGGKKPQITTSSICGRCRKPGLRNLDRPMMTVKTYPGRGIDDGVDFNYDPDEYTMDWLRERRDLVWEFDEAVDYGIANFIEFCKTHKIVDEEIQVTKTIKVAEEC